MLMLMMMAASTENQVIDCSDQDVIQKIYKQMAKYAIHKVRSMIGREDIAAEIVQEVFLKLWQKKPKFPHEKAVYAWIYTASNRKAIDHLRSASNKSEQFPLELAQNQIQLHDRDLILEKDLIQTCLKKLSQRESEIFTYIVFDDMPYDEIASILDISSKTVQRDWQKIKKKLETIASHHHGK